MSSSPEKSIRFGALAAALAGVFGARGEGRTIERRQALSGPELESLGRFGLVKFSNKLRHRFANSFEHLWQRL